MSYLNIKNLVPKVLVQTESMECELIEKDGSWCKEDISINLIHKEDSLDVRLYAEETPIMRIWLVWEIEVEKTVQILGDAWERGYGDLEWRGIVPERVMPWYIMISESGLTHGYGVKTGPASMCSWRLDRHHLRLCLDVRNGGCGVLLKGRELDTASIVSREGIAGESAYEATKAFCHVMCSNPRLPKQPIYGSNNWYYAYGESSAEQIRKDATLLAELSENNVIRPYMVIDDGWQKMHAISCSGGPWDCGNFKFPDMRELATEIREMNLHPGLWFRPLSTYECYPNECYLPKCEEGAHLLDPSHPYVLERIEQMTRGLKDWGFELLKHDFSTYDLFGRWGFRMEDVMTEDNWKFYDQSKTTAEIVLDLYQAIRRGAGENILIIGCNTISHLAAGIFEIQRTGDDTSGISWKRTRKMGVNTLAFRMPQNGAFYASDADCVGMTGKIDWRLNQEWIRLLSVSGTPMFLSIDPNVITVEQKTYVQAAFKTFLKVKREAIPLDWMMSTCPEEWQTSEGVQNFLFPDNVY